MNYKPSHQTETKAILDAIRLIVRALRVSSRAAERDVGLSSAQLFVLQNLKDAVKISLNELARKTLTHQSSVSVVVTKLCEQGYLQKTPSKDDERRLDISITAKGQALIKEKPEPIQERLIAAIEGLPSTNRHWLAEGLKQVVESSGLSSDEVPLFFEEK